MALRDTPLVINEYYHCYNRGVDKRTVFLDYDDFDYFLTAINLFNQVSAHGDMAHYKYEHKKYSNIINPEPLVSILAYCLNPNHFHLLLKQEVDDGISKFIQKVSTGYTLYFNKKYERTGSLFQGKFKSVYIDNDIQLKHIFSYVTLNNLVHGIKDVKKFRNSYQETIGNSVSNICDKNSVQDIFEKNDDLEKIVNSGVAYTISYRKTLEASEKSEFLE